MHSFWWILSQINLFLAEIIMLLRPSYFEKNHNHKIKLVKIDTEEHIGGVITKGLVIVPFEYLKKKLMGC